MTVKGTKLGIYWYVINLIKGCDSSYYKTCVFSVPLSIYSDIGNSSVRVRHLTIV